MRVFFVYLAILSTVSAYKYLVFNPIFGHSHCTFLGKIADTLAEAGHDVTVLQPILEPLLADKVYSKKANKIISVDVDPRVLTMIEDGRNGLFKNLWTMSASPFGMFDMVRNMSLMAAYGCEHVMNQDALFEQLRKEKFDVGIAEPFNSCGFGVFEVLEINTVISAFSGINLDVISHYIGEPAAYSYVPSIASQTDKMNLFQRLGNVFGGIIGFHMFDSIFQAETDVIQRKFGDKYSGHGEALAKAAFNFINANPYLDFPRPLLAKTVQVGGITVDTKTPEKLEEKWDKILSERKKNVFISFGSVAKSKDMPQNYKEQLLDVFKSMPDVTFIWKYEEASTMADHLPNVHLSPWLPQKSLLADSRLNTFVTHGGLGSTTEVATLGKPAVFIPLFAEQPRNAAMLQRHGTAVVLEKEDLADASLIRKAIQTILDDDTYAVKAQKLSQMLKEQPISARDQVVKHAEFAAKFGPLPQLDPYGRHLTTIQYYLLDVIALVLLFIVILISVPVFLIRRYCFAKKQKVD